MTTQFNMNPYASTPVEVPKETMVSLETVSLLRQMVEMQREQLNLARAIAMAHDATARWKTFLGRWKGDFPDLGPACRDALPVLERTYGALLSEMSEYLRQGGPSALDNDFTLQEFLDKYGMRLTQLGTILNLVAPVAEAAPAEPTPGS